jgi:hypothetical protein
MNYKALIIGIFFFIASQVVIWFQSHLQFFNKWAADNPIIISSVGMVVSYGSIMATKHIAGAFGGLVWPSRFIGFSIGIVLFSTLTWIFLKEPISLKSAVCIGLAFCILAIQLFWKN